MEKNTTILTPVRALFGMLAIGLPFAGFIVQYFQAEIGVEFNDSILARIIIGGICFGVFILLYVSDFVKENHILISRVSLYLLSSYFYVLCYLNDLYPFYFAISSILIASSPLFFIEWKRFMPFFVFNLVISLTLLILLRENSLEAIYFLLVQGFGFVLSIIGLSVLNSFLSHLTFSNQIINTADALILASNELGEITFVSSNVERILGYSRREILGMGWWMIRNNNTKDQNELFDYAEKMRKMHKLKTGGYDAPITTASGDEKWFHWTVTFQKNGASIGIGQDVTAQIKAKEETKKLSLIAQNTDNIVVLTDNQDRVEWVNPAFHRITGYTLSDVKRKVPTKNLAGSKTDLVLLNATIREVFLEKKACFGEFELYKKSGEIFWCSLNFTPVFGENNSVTNVIAIGRDITEQKLANEKIRIYSERLQALHTLDRNILVADSLEEVFQGTLNSIHTIGVNLRRVSISVFNFDDSNVKILSKTERSEDSDVYTKWDNNEIPITDFQNLLHTFKDAEYLLQNLTTAKENLLTPFQREIKSLGVESYLSIPIRHDSDLIGSVNFAAATQDVFTQDTIDFLIELAKDISSAVYQSKLKETISKKSSKLEEKNKDISDSITYAERIQKSIFPSKTSIEHNFNDHFILFRSKDVLSGDFYFYEECDDLYWIAAVDCTGHGVPGALVSIVAHGLLMEAIHEKQFNTPAEVLAYLNAKLIERMSNDETEIKDGLDISLCVVNNKTNEMTFSGVMNNLVRVRHDELTEYKANRMAIGINRERLAVDFEQYTFKLESKDKIYLFSDGFPDQFGGPKDKKFGTRKFKNLLEEISNYPMKEQCRILENSLDFWMKDEEQTDDILVFGLEF